MIIDIAEVFEKARIRQSEKPEWEVVKSDELEYIEEKEIITPQLNKAVPVKRDPEPEERGSMAKGDILTNLETQMRNIRIARAKCSNRYPQMVRDGAPAHKMLANYGEIQSYTAQMQEIYSHMRYVERYGQLPDPEPEHTDPKDSDNLIELQKLSRSLVDKRCKLKKKLQPNARTPKNPDRYTVWALELDQVEAEYKEVKSRIRELKIKLNQEDE